MGVEALERLGVPGAADPELERRAAVRPLPVGELAADRALLVRRPLEVGAQSVVRLDLGAPAFDSPGGLEARDGRDEVAACQPVGRGEGLALRAVAGTVGIGFMRSLPGTRRPCSSRW